MTNGEVRTVNIFLLEKTLQEKDARIEELEAALGPFGLAAGNIAACWPNNTGVWTPTASDKTVPGITVGHLRTAAKVLDQ